MSAVRPIADSVSIIRSIDDWIRKKVNGRLLGNPRR